MSILVMTSSLYKLYMILLQSKPYKQYYQPVRCTYQASMLFSKSILYKLYMNLLQSKLYRRYS